MEDSHASAELESYIAERGTWGVGFWLNSSLTRPSDNDIATILLPKQIWRDIRWRCLVLAVRGLKLLVRPRLLRQSRSLDGRRADGSVHEPEIHAQLGEGNEDEENDQPHGYSAVLRA